MPCRAEVAAIKDRASCTRVQPHAPDVALAHLDGYQPRCIRQRSARVAGPASAKPLLRRRTAAAFLLEGATPLGGTTASRARSASRAACTDDADDFVFCCSIAIVVRKHARWPNGRFMATRSINRRSAVGRRLPVEPGASSHSWCDTAGCLVSAFQLLAESAVVAYLVSARPAVGIGHQ